MSGIPLLRRAWRVLVGAAFVFGLQFYLGGWWLDNGNEAVLTGFIGAAALAALAADSLGHAFWLWVGIMGGMGIMPEVLKSNIFPIVLMIGGWIMGMGVALGWAIRNLIVWVQTNKKGNPKAPLQGR